MRSFLIGSGVAIFSPVTVVLLFDQPHDVAALYRELLSVCILVVACHRIFAGTLFKVEIRRKKKLR